MASRERQKQHYRPQRGQLAAHGLPGVEAVGIRFAKG